MEQRENTQNQGQLCVCPKNTLRKHKCFKKHMIMNKLIFRILPAAILLVAVFAVALVNCKKVTRQTQFKTIEYTGCNNKTELSEDYREAINQTDTLVASIKDDLLKLTVGVNLYMLFYV